MELNQNTVEDTGVHADMSKPVIHQRKKELIIPWSNMANVVYKRTYARKDNGPLETWERTIERTIRGNIDGHNVRAKEAQMLEYLMLNRKAGPAGRGLWFSGAPAHKKIGGAALNNCWFLTGETWDNLVMAQDLLMLGGGVGMSVEKEFVSKLPKVKKDVHIVHRKSADADFIVPDSREGWGGLTTKILQSFFETGKSFDYSTILIRGKGEAIKGFGGSASGPIPMIKFVEKLSLVLQSRAGKSIRPIDMADLLCCIAEMVVAGNVRRSALMIQGDAWDKDFLRVKRWDLGTIPSQRSNANFSVVCDDVDDLHPYFWKSYEIGEPIGIINRTNIQKYGRMGELKRDYAIGVNPCAEAMLVDGEPCNLQEIALPNLTDKKEFILASKLMHRYGKRVTLEHYHHEKSQKVVEKYRRIGTGITGCLQSDLFTPKVLDEAYAAIQEENVRYSKELGIKESIRTTVIKPSGTMSKVFDCHGEGIHGAFARYMIQRIRFSADDPIVPLLRKAGHHIEPDKKLDGTLDHGTLVVDFYREAPEGMPVAGETLDTWQQLEHVKMAQKHWADQSVSVTVYYKKEEIPQLKEWLRKNLSEIKTISFLLQQGHGFDLAPKEGITAEEFERLSARIKPIDLSQIGNGFEIDSLECAGGACPVK